MGHVYEVVVAGVLLNVPYANIFHVWDGDENETPDDVADVFETNYLVDIAALQIDHLTYNRIDVKALDVGNGLDPITRVVNITGTATGDMAPHGIHAWIKLVSDDNGFKSGGKLIGGWDEGNITDGSFTVSHLAAIQVVFDALVVDLTAASLSLAIYRPSLSTPGFPSISICSAPVARGLGTNNRRQKAFQL